METMKLYPALLSMQNLFILTCFCPPSCGHMISDSSSMLELIKTILQSHSTMSFVPTISDCYDTTIHSLVKLLVDVVFPEQEQEYNIKTAMLTTHYRQPRHQLPEFLPGRPCLVQATCIGNIDSIIFMETDGCYGMISNSGGTHTVDICNGVCTCKSFTLQQIPCKHMFAVFSQSNWSWNDLPKSLTNSVNLVFELGVVTIYQLITSVIIYCHCQCFTTVT